MIFRPKIFISSTFNENKTLRESIRKFFYSVGAEPLLYEHELTPSIIPKSYRTNLLDADFMIMIVKDNYGTETEYGISGIHEEYKIALNNKIPLHVYLKKTEKADDDKKLINPLIDDLIKDGISYYYFKDDRELIKRLKETTFTIAKDIMLSQIEKNKLPDETVCKFAYERDYQKSIEVINIVEDMKKISAEYEYDYIYSTIIAACFEPIEYEFRTIQHKFINWELENQLHNMINTAKNFINHFSRDFTGNGYQREHVINILGKVCIENSSSYSQSTDWSMDDYRKERDHLFEEYEKFKDIAKNVRMESDIIR